MSDTASRADLEMISETFQGHDLDHVMILHPDATLTDAPYERPYWVPEVSHSPTNDVDIHDGLDHLWQAMTGLTGQHGYNGAVLHPSEVMAPGVARAMLDIVRGEEAPIAFVLTEVRDEDLSHPEDPIGWTILYRPVVG